VSGAGWLSDNPGKAWAERYLLWASLTWIGAVAVVVLTGALQRWTESGYLVFSLACAAPMSVVPVALARRRGEPLLASYVVKLNVFVALLVFFGTYVGTHYFFDLMGMRYAFPTRMAFEAELVGKSGMHVPVFMYPLTQAYFMTYFTALVAAHRGLSRRLGLTGQTTTLARLGSAALVLGLSYVVAFAETFFMATDLMSAWFWYEKQGRMLALGSIGYAIYFVVGLPMVKGLDEDASRTWPMSRVVVVGLAASMAIFYGLEAWAKLVGAL
jgi:cycloeucalenol cycloisomerase